MRFLIVIALTVCFMNNRQTTQVLKDDIQETRAPNFETDNNKSEIERRAEILGEEPLRLGQ